MANINELQIALDLLEKEKGIDKEYMLDALKTALIHAYKRNYKDECENIEINISDSGNVKVIASKIVVEDFDEQFGPDDNQILLNDAILEEFSIKSSDIITATVRRFEKVVPRPTDDKPAKPQPVKINVILDIGKAEATMTSREQVKGENYTINDKLKVLVLDVRNSPRGPHILVSRAHADLVRRLFEREVPEIADGILEIKSVAREAGVRSKIAVFSNDPNVDPVGSCVGNRGSRVNAVVEELWGEKVDIVKYSDDPTEYLTAAISPAKVSKVIVSEEWETLGKKEATVVVDDSQLSLAIGKEGLNARLAAKLTGWKIDIKSTSQYEVSE